MNNRLFGGGIQHPPVQAQHLNGKSPQFKLIYDLILKQDQKGLKRLLSEGRSLTLHEQNHTPISLIAAQGLFGCIRWIIDSAPVHLEEVVQGFAQGGHRESAHFYTLSAQPKKLKVAESMGYGLQGNENHLEILQKNDYSTEEKLAFIEGLGQGGHHQLLDQAMAKFTHPHTYSHALLGLAKGLHTDTLQDKLDQAAPNQTQLDMITFGLSVSGHHLTAFKYGEHRKLEETVRLICQGLAFGGHSDTIELYLREAAKNNLHTFERLLWEVTQGYGDGGHFIYPDLATRLLTHIPDRDLRHKYAILISTLYTPDINPQEFTIEADGLAMLMQKQELSFENARPLYHPLLDGMEEEPSKQLR